MSNTIGTRLSSNGRVMLVMPRRKHPLAIEHRSGLNIPARVWWCVSQITANEDVEPAGPSITARVHPDIHESLKALPDVVWMRVRPRELLPLRPRQAKEKIGAAARQHGVLPVSRWGGHCQRIRMNITIPVLPLWQPWASAMEVLDKRVETRGWVVKHRGLFAIHATKKWDKPKIARFSAEPQFTGVREAYPDGEDTAPRRDRRHRHRGGVLARRRVPETPRLHRQPGARTRAVRRRRASSLRPRDCRPRARAAVYPLQGKPADVCPVAGGPRTNSRATPAARRAASTRNRP